MNSKYANYTTNIFNKKKLITSLRSQGIISQVAKSPKKTQETTEE